MPVCTFGAVSADALPHDELPLPQHGPDQVPRAAADLDHLSGEGYLLPRWALGIVVTDSLSEQHLSGDKAVLDDTGWQQNQWEINK